jgi:hypothetical protein
MGWASEAPAFRQASRSHKTISAITPESAVSIAGRVVDAPAVKLGGPGSRAESIAVDGLADVPLPVAEDTAQKRRTGWCALSLRPFDERLGFEIQTTLEQRWRARGLVEVHSPELMGVALRYLKSHSLGAGLTSAVLRADDCYRRI